MRFVEYVAKYSTEGKKEEDILFCNGCCQNFFKYETFEFIDEIKTCNNPVQDNLVDGAQISIATTFICPICGYVNRAMYAPKISNEVAKTLIRENPPVYVGNK